MNDLSVDELSMNMQTMVGDSARRIFADHIDRKLLEQFETGQFCAPLWKLVSDAGFGLTTVPEEAGGVGGQWRDAADLLFAIGQFNLPLPLAETMIANHLLAAAGIALPDTDKPLALIEAGQHAQLEFSSSQGSTILSGRAQAVAWARDCDWLVISNSVAPGQTQIALMDLRQPKAITIQQGSNLAAEPRDDLHFDRAACEAVALDTALPLAQPVWQLGALARSAMMSGALKQVLDLSVRYANERVQFGKPIGKNQAIQQPLAMLAGEIGAAQMASRIALDAMSAPAAGAGGSQAFDIAVAKVRNGQAATQANGIVHQVHGAIGFTYEHMLHFSTRRLWSWRSDYGSDGYWARALGKAAIAQGGAGFWPSIAGRSLQPRL